MRYEPVIGLEVHAQLKTKTKIFCSCSVEFGAEPNSHTCPICLGMPGVLPVLNKKVVDFAIKMAIATNCTVSKISRFARKNYFYPDLPKGYQISQYEMPLAENGHLDIELEDGKKKRIGITRIHLEEDAGKSTHDLNRPISKVDLNRTGTPLAEIVSEPDLRSAKEAGAYLRLLRSYLRYIDVCDGNLEEGSFRCDANISLRPIGEEKLGTRTELKNLNSFRNVEKAIAYEIERQTIVLDKGEAIIQETRLWDANKNRTLSMRKKEEANDYRYFPDPDLLPIVIEQKLIEKIKKTIPELPNIKQKRFIEEFSIPSYDAGVLTSSKALADYFEECAKDLKNKKQASNWIMTSILGLLNTQNKSIKDSPISAKDLSKLLSFVEKDIINGRIAKTIFEEMVETGKKPADIIEEKNLSQVSDSSEIKEIIIQVLAENQSEVEAYKNGKTKLLSFFIGQVMRKTKGKANPKILNEILKDLLK